MTGKQLQRMLDTANMSQRRMALLIGIGERHMRRYIAGDATIPKHIEIAIKCICEHSAKTV